MSEPAKAEKPALPKAVAAKPKSAAPLSKPIAGHSPATPALKRLRRELGEMLAGFKARKTHMFQIYGIHVRSALDAALPMRRLATETERTELDALEVRARFLLLHIPDPNATSKDDGGIGIDWDQIADSLDQLVPAGGLLVRQSPQAYLDCAEAIVRSTLHIKTAFAEQWVEIQKHWFEFLHATATMVALETAAIIASATPGTQLLGVIVQGLIIAFVAYAAVQVGMEAGQLTTTFWLSVRDANGDPKKLDLAALHFARLVIFILRLLAEAAAGGALAKISMKGIKSVMGDAPVTPRPTHSEPHSSPAKGSEPASGSAKPSQAPKPEAHSSSKPATSSGEHGSDSTSHPSTKPVEKTRITEPVKGVWEQKEHPRFNQPEFADLTIVEDVFYENGIRKALTEVRDASGNTVGHLIRTYNPATGVLELSEAFLDKLPNKIVPADGKMLTSNGTPTQTYLTIRQMKALGVEYGGLKKVKMSTIQNIQSIIQLHVMKTTEPTMSLHEKVRRTASVSYAETTLTQSGHRIVDVKYGDAHLVTDHKLGSLMDYYERNFGRSKVRDPSMIQKHDALLKKYGTHEGKQLVTRDTIAMYNYDIELTLAPLPTGGTK